MSNQELNSIEVGKFLDLSNDYAFKLIFGNEDNKHLLKQLINSFIPDRQIVDLHFKDRESQGLTPQNKYVFFDLHCKDENGNEFLVEVQKRSLKYFYSRTLYYASLLYASNAELGDIQYKSLKPVYVISLLCSPLKEAEFQELDDLVLWYQMCEKTHKCFAPNGINIIFANIFRAADSVDKCKTDSEKWCQIIRDMNKYECEPNEVGGGYWKELATLSQSCLYNKETIVDYKKSIMDADYSKALIMDSFEEGLKDGREEGLAEGLAEGEARGITKGEIKGKLEGKLEMIKTLFINGMSLDMISQYSGISISELNSLCQS